MNRRRKPFVVFVDGETAELSADELRAAHPQLTLASSLLALRPNVRPGSVCPACGWTASQVENTERVGCPLCYESLDATLLRSFQARPSS